MATTSKSPETDLRTSSAEERTRTFDVPQAARARMAPGPGPGDVLKNRFVLHQCIAEGSTSRLFRAMDRRRDAAGEPDPWVVLKVVTAPGAGQAREAEPRALNALRREAAIAQGLEHPNLPRIIGIDQDGPHTFLCMAWLEGESLAAILDSRGARPMTRVQALHILDGVGRALTHVHALGITHADVKPGNILVTAQGEATLLDFGVALGPGAGDLPDARGHTPEYASPQVLAGQEPTPADDLFSLACVAYRMLAGDRAFGAGTAGDAEAAGQRPARPTQLSPAQWRALDRALAFASQERQPDVASFIAQLKGARDETAAATDGLPVATAAAVALEGDEPRRRHGLRVGMGVAAAVALVTVALVLRDGTAPEPGAAGSLPAPPAPGPAQAEAPAAELAPEPLPAAAPASLNPLVVPPESVRRPAEDAAPVAPPAPLPRASPAPKRSAVPLVAAKAEVAPPEAMGPPVPEPEVVAPAANPAPAAGGGTIANTAAAPRSVPFSALTVRNYVEPAYPRNAAARRVEGWVDVAFVVEASGRTSAVQVVASDPPDIFDDAALAAVRRWRFAEAGDRAEPVSSRIRVRFDPSASAR